jgi:hypothetical protein
MQIDTWYDLAVRELSEMTDHAREMISEAERTAPPVTPETEAPAEPPARAA